MKRHIPGLHEQSVDEPNVPEGLFLVRVSRVSYIHRIQKRFFVVRVTIVAPQELEGRTITGRLYSTPRALWKLTWFLRDFGYDAELLNQDLVDEKALLGLQGVVKVSHARVNGRCVPNLEGFAPAEAWEGLPAALARQQKKENDL